MLSLFLFIGIAKAQATESCQPCPTSQLNTKEPSQYFMAGMCLIANTIVCNPILFGLVFLFILVVGIILYLRKRVFG